jgi:uncharacterized alpha-E superfamily protein
MLSRTAVNLYWMARYMERTEYVARLLDAAVRMTSLAGAGVASGNEWESALAAAGSVDAYGARYDEVDADGVIRFLVLDADNPSSVWCVLEQARSNARAERATLTLDAWASINDTWLARGVLERARGGADDLGEIIDWVKSRSAAFRGAVHGTLLRNDAYHFIRLGMAIERADNTARLLDVKYHVLLPKHDAVGGGLDHFQWDSILRAASALRAYHHVFRDSVRPAKVVELLALRPEMPRSIRASFDEITDALRDLASVYGGKMGEAQRLAGATHSLLAFSTVEDVFKLGLHEFLKGMIDSTASVGAAIQTQYMA